MSLNQVRLQNPIFFNKITGESVLKKIWAFENMDNQKPPKNVWFQELIGLLPAAHANSNMSHR